MSYIPAVILLMVIYMASLVGLITPHQQDWYLYYTPFFILLNALLLIIYHKNWDKAALQFIALSLGLGFLIELLAVQTPLLYGSYHFGKTLGFQLLEVPLVMTSYWFVLAYSTASLTNKLPLPNKWLTIFLGAFLMMGLTGLIQQVSNPLDFWHLQGNYSFARYLIIWFLAGSVLQYAFINRKVDHNNPIAIYVYGGLSIFFMGLLNFL